MALTINNLGVVRKEVLEACTKWYDIGLELNIPVATLDSIEGQFDNHSDKLRETLKVWLKTAAEHSWQDVVGVLKCPVVGEPKLASDIEAKHCTTAETGEASGHMMPAAKRLKTTDMTLEQALQENQELRIKDQDSQRRIDTLQQELYVQDSQRQIEKLTHQVEEKTQQLQTIKQDLLQHEQTNQELKRQLQETQELRTKEQESQRHIQQEELESHQKQIKELTRQVEETKQQQQTTETKLQRVIEKHEQQLQETYEQLQRQRQKVLRM